MDTKEDNIEDVEPDHLNDFNSMWSFSGGKTENIKAPLHDYEAFVQYIESIDIFYSVTRH